MNALKLIGLGLLGSLLITCLVLTYEVFLFEIVNEHRLDQHKHLLVKNFEKHSDEFKALRIAAMDLPDISHLWFDEDGKIHFKIVNQRPSPESHAAFFWLNDTVSCELQFLNNDSIAANEYDHRIRSSNWYITFDSDANHPDFPALMNYLKTDTAQLWHIRELMDKAQTWQLFKQDDVVWLSYAGNTFLSLDYFVPSKDSVISKDLPMLNEHFYYSVEFHGMICGQMQW